MAAGSLIAGSITAYIQDIFEDAMLVARDSNVMSALVTNFNDRTGDANRVNSLYQEGTIAALAESDDLSSQHMTPAAIATLDPAEFGMQYFLNDLRVESDPFSVRNDAATSMGNALGEHVESNLLGHFDNFTGGTVGVAGSVLTWGRFFAARAQLRNTKARPPYACVLHEYQWFDLAKDASIAAPIQGAAPNFTDEVMSRYYVGRAGDVDIYTTVTIGTGTAVFGGMFSRDALAIDWRRAPRIEPERDASRRGVELNLSAVYAHGIWRPGFGIAVLADASAPTA
jgi:hypothetical protein